MPLSFLNKIRQKSIYSMIKVNPTESPSVLHITPRSIVASVSVVYRDEVTNVETTQSGSMTAVGNEARIESDLTLVEGHSYSFRVLDDTTELYRGKIYATSDDSQTHSIAKDYTIDTSYEGKTYHY